MYIYVYVYIYIIYIYIYKLHSLFDKTLVRQDKMVLYPGFLLDVWEKYRKETLSLTLTYFFCILLQ